MKKGYSNMNIFIKYIYEKVPYRYIFRRIKNNIATRKFRRNILNGSPSFIILWQMADFIKLAETIFFYDNRISGNNYLFSSRLYDSGENGFKLSDEDAGVEMVIKLLKNSRKVILNITRLKGKEKTSIMTFTQDEWDNDHTIYDEMLLEQVIKVINRRIIKLFDDCYSKM